MKYALDTEFIDTGCSALISLGIVGEDGREAYFEFYFPDDAITPWLKQNVIPHLKGTKFTFGEASKKLIDFVDGTIPEIWCYYGAYDWYWFCRIFGGRMNVPRPFENFFHEFREKQNGVPDINGPAHNALNDARSLMDAMRKHRL